MIEVNQYAAYAKQLAKWSLESGENLQLFISTLAKFPKYSLNNILLIMGYNHAATDIRPEEKWQEMGVKVDKWSDNIRYIPIIEPVKGTGEYVMQFYVDAADTDYKEKKQEYDCIEALQLLLNGNIENCKVVDEIKPGVRAMYDTNTDMILIKRSNMASPNEFFCAIAHEMVHRSRAKEQETGTYKRATNQLYAMSAAQALADKFGIESNIGFDNLPEKYSKLDEKNAFKVLEEIRGEYKKLHTHVSENIKILGDKQKEGDISERGKS